ncbi:squalene--hopene cyclase [uncultured Enterovirga sp.]|uniref:squalene--hopene cyclase n=1 Tax=uncultured Enterovirga sp. TaxID=2026352 RepID=UPI0035C9DF36
MNFVAPIRHEHGAAPAEFALESSITSATAALLRSQHEDGHWCFELEADATIPAEYVLLRHYLAETPDLDLEAKIARYLRRIQGEHGGWPLYHGGALDLSASVKAYFALKMIGDDPNEPHMAQAREAILAQGGAASVNVFTRTLLALYGEVSWKTIPSMPVEMILLPRWFPIHLGKMSYWARTVLAPLLVIMALKPQARNPRGIGIPELFGSTPAPRRGTQSHAKRGWAALFKSLDIVLKGVDPHWPTKLRARAIDQAVAFTRERLNGEDGLGGIYPAMSNSIVMFDALGFGEDYPERVVARRAIEKLLVDDGEEAYLQPCVSPVWDTALAAHALLETGDGEAEQAVVEAMHWLKPRQILDVKGDWAEDRPDLRPGGWAFQYGNAHYPDTDDTAAVVMAMDRLRPKLAGKNDFDEPVARAREWIEGMQSRDGGWGAFDVDNTYEYLNNIPFADHGALLDAPTVDVSARCVGMLAQLGEPSDSPRMKAALAYLEQDQREDGSWFGRWGVNYVYGTWSALIALNAAGADLSSPVVARAAAWLVAVQNPDGGWGEDCDSYRLNYSGYQAAPSTPSQSAWALLGLMAAGCVESEAVERGIRYLTETQEADGLWHQDSYTGGGFPRVFYLRYHGYPKYFPLWALARYRNLKRSNTQRVAWGM